MFNKKQFSNLIIRAIGSESKTNFANLSGVNRTYLSKYVNMQLNDPPSPGILKKIADNSKDDSVTYYKLMFASGYMNEIYDKNDEANFFFGLKDTEVRIPILGKVSAGKPFEAVENNDLDEWIDVPENLITEGSYFALRIKGDSMEPKISEGDIVIVKEQEDVNSGEIGVVIVDGSDATVKKVMKQDDGIMLVAANQNVYSPTFYNKKQIEELPVKIIGRVVELRAKF